jgi:hypothetical protein
MLGLQDDPEGENKVMELLLSTIKLGGEDAIDALELTFGSVIDALITSLRGMFTAAPGKTFYVADFSAIEAVVTAWLAGEDWKVQAFKDIQAGKGYEGSKDIYCATASKVFGYKVLNKKEHPKERQVGKTCLGPDTPVITNNGVKQLTSVTKDDMLWDGVSWVRHSGVVFNGLRKVLNLQGIWITEDHEILTKENWQEAQMVESCLSTRLSAAETGLESWRWLASSIRLEYYANAHAALHSMKSIQAISDLENRQDVIDALKKLLENGERITGNIQTFVQMMSLGEDYSIASLQQLADAITRKILLTLTTAEEVLRYAENGVRIDAVSSNTFLALRDMISHISKWIELIQTEDMSPEIYGSSLENKINRIKEKYKNYKSVSMSWSRVYDITNTGPNSRFTILTDDGPLVVHNCELAFGYGGGVGAWRNFDSSDKYTDDEVDQYKKDWRYQHQATVSLWYGLENAAVDSLRLDTAVRYRNIVFEPVYDKAGKWLTAILPNGRRLWYFDPILMPGKFGNMQVTYQGRDNKKGGSWGRIFTYGGMLTENVVQAISRDLMAEAMIRVEKIGYTIVLTVHDEIVAEVDLGFGSLKEFEREMSIVPPWAHGCPVGVDGWQGFRYRK